MKIKDPSLRSCYSHPLLSKIEEDIDDHRDTKGYYIDEGEFQNIVSKYQESVPNEAELLYDLAYENFIETSEDTELHTHLEFEGCDDRDFPEYKYILTQLEKVSDDMWEAYDKETHTHCQELCYNILDQDKVIQVATQIAMHQLSFDEETCVCLHTILFVLKTIVPYKTNSKYQNSIKRAESWLQDASLM